MAVIALAAVSISAAVTLAATSCRSWGVSNTWLERWALPPEALEKIVPVATAAWISTALVASTDGDAGGLTAGIGQVVLGTLGALLVSSLLEKGWLKSCRKWNNHWTGVYANSRLRAKFSAAYVYLDTCKD